MSHRTNKLPSHRSEIALALTIKAYQAIPIVLDA